MKVYRVSETEDRITPGALNGSAVHLVPAGAVLMVTRSGILRHSFPVATTSEQVSLNQDLKGLVPFNGVDPEYLAFALRRWEREILTSCAKHGTTVHSIKSDALKRVPIPIAPRSEQRRIVEKIDELFSDIEQGETALRRAKALLQRYRQAVLKAAVTGELTRGWREQHRGEIETGEQLLARILEARRAAWEKAELARMAAKGQRPKDDSCSAATRSLCGPTAPTSLSCPTAGWRRRSTSSFRADLDHFRVAPLAATSSTRISKRRGPRAWDRQRR
jgi:type I restriction enzyme S subunit